MIKIEVQSTRAVIRSQEPLTVGLRGAKAQFTFGRGWEELTKTAVFRQGDKTVAVAKVDQEVTIPWEVLEAPGVPVEIGVYGVDSTAAIAIPTLWTVTQPVRPGTEPEGDPSTEPTPGLWEQMQGKLGSLEEAIKEANNPVRVITVSHHEDDVYVADHDVAAIQSMMEAKLPFACYWYDRDVMLQLSAFQPNGPFCFTAVDNLTEYQVVISEKGVDCTIMKLADADTKFPNPEKLTFTGVVNGEYDGSKPLNVELPAPVYLVTLNSYDRAEQPFNDIKAAYTAGHVIQCDYKGFLLPLRWITDNECCFSGVAGVTSYNVVVRSAGNAIISEHSLAQKTDIPTKTSQLENDSGYRTSVPVTSVNGQTGKVTVHTPIKVIIEELPDGTLQPDPPYAEFEELLEEGHALYCQHGSLVLSLADVTQHHCIFSCVQDGHVHMVKIKQSSVEVTSTPLAFNNDESNVNNPGIWHGKKFAAFGTSITWACQNHSGGYLEVIKNRCGFASYLNAGVSGAAMANNTANGNGINHKIRNTDISGYDLVLIECTTNDFKLNVPLGTVGIMGDTDFATNSFCGALRDSIEYILKADPEKHILLISDTQRDNAGYDVNYTNSAGHKLVDYVQALREVAELYGLPVCDWYRNSGFNALTFGTYTIDGLHPNGTGYTVLGNLTAASIEAMYCSFTTSRDTGGDGGDVNPNVITINGVDYDASVADGFDYRMVIDIGGTKYLYYSAKPFKIYEPKYSECYYNPSYRATASGKTFGNGAAIAVAGNHINCGDGYYAMVNSRTLDQYVWTNHDLYYSDSDRIAVAKS